MNSSQDTPINNTNLIIEAINNAVNGLRQEMNERFNNVEARLRRIENENEEIKTDVAEMKNLQLSFDVRLDRLESMAHESLQISYGVRADVKVLRAEVSAWSKDVRDLQRLAA